MNNPSVYEVVVESEDFTKTVRLFVLEHEPIAIAAHLIQQYIDAYYRRCGPRIMAIKMLDFDTTVITDKE